jgi:hypothetical protein
MIIKEKRKNPFVYNHLSWVTKFMDGILEPICLKDEPKEWIGIAI